MTKRSCQDQDSQQDQVITQDKVIFQAQDKMELLLKQENFYHVVCKIKTHGLTIRSPHF